MNKKKLTSLSLALTVTAGLFSGMTVQAAQYYNDVDDGHWAYEWIGYMNECGYISGYPDGGYYPSQNITRAEYVTILNKMFEAEGSAGKNYSDVSEEDWFYSNIQAAVAAGYLRGYDDANEENDGTMKPNSFITREEAAVILASAYGLEKNSDVSKFADADDISDWAVPYVGALVAGNVLMGDDDLNFRPKDNILRAEVASMLAQAKQNESGLKYEEKINLPESLEIDENNAYSFSGIKTKNISPEKKIFVSVDASENGNVGAYKIIAYLGDVIIAENVTLDGLKEVLNGKEFSAEDLEKLTISFSDFEKPESGSSLKLTVKVSSGDKDYDSKEYTIAFGESSVVWPSITKNSDTQYTISGISTDYVAELILSVSEQLSGNVGDYAMTVTVGDEEIASDVTLAELSNILADKKFSAQDVKSLKVVITAAAPAKGSSLKLTFKFADSETKDAVGDEKVYELTFGKAETSTGGLSGGSGGSSVKNPEYYSRDRVAESLNDYRNDLLNNSSARKIADDNTKYGISDDMLKVVLTNDGMNTFRDSENNQAKYADRVNTVYNSLKDGLGDKDNYYDNLYAVYEDVITAVLADTTLNYKSGSDITTATKEKYVLLFRAMVKTINSAADTAITVYNAAENASKSADEKFDIFKTEAINNTTSILNTDLTDFETTEKQNIATCAAAYITAIFNANKGNATLKGDLTAAGTLTIESFATILKNYL